MAMQQPMRHEEPMRSVPPAYTTEWHETPTAWMDRVRWGPVLAGVVCTMATLALLSALGFAFGNAFFGAPAGAAADDAGQFWPIVGAAIAFFVGGWMAGKTAWFSNPGWGAWHGVMVWAFSTAATLFLFAFGAGWFNGAWGFGTGTTDTTAGGLFTGDRSWWPFLSMIVGLAAAAIGGFVGAPKEQWGERWGSTTTTTTTHLP